MKFESRHCILQDPYPSQPQVEFAPPGVAAVLHSWLGIGGGLASCGLDTADLPQCPVAIRFAHHSATRI